MKNMTLSAGDDDVGRFTHLLLETAMLLEPLPAHTALIQTLADRLADTLSLEPLEGLAFQRSVRFGSLSRQTALSPLNDDDRLLVFRPVKPLSTRSPWLSPRGFLETLQARVAALLEDFEADAPIPVRPQDHSIGLRFTHRQTPDHTGLELRIDLVPVLLGTSEGRVRLPERSTDSWLPACPYHMRDRLNLLSEHQPSVRPAIRLLKGWKRLEALPLPSYALELLVTRCALRHATTLEVGALVTAVLADLETRAVHFAQATHAAKAALQDPWTRRNVLAQLGPAEWACLVSACREASTKLDTAASAVHAGDIQQARITLGELFIGRTSLQQSRRIRRALPRHSAWFSEDPSDAEQ